MKNEWNKMLNTNKNPLPWQNCELEKKKSYVHTYTHAKDNTDTHVKDSADTRVKDSADTYVTDSAYIHTKGCSRVLRISCTLAKSTGRKEAALRDSSLGEDAGNVYGVTITL